LTECVEYAGVVSEVDMTFFIFSLFIK
jgi:hypothetical protein